MSRHRASGGDVLAVAAGILDDAVAAGLGSAAALGVLTPQGSRHTHHVGTLGRVRRDGAAVALVAVVGRPGGRATRYDLASLTKPMATSTLAAQLLADPDSGWRLDTPLATVFAEAAGRPCAETTIGALISHASGLPAWRDFYAATADIPAAQRAAAVRELVLATPLQQPPGAEAVYSDLGFLLLGWAIEATLGCGLDSAFAERVATPLRLESTAFARISARPGPDPRVCPTEIWPPRSPDGRPLVGEVHDDNCCALDGVGGHAGLFGPLEDALRWAGQWLGLARGRDSAALAIDAATAAELIGHRGAPGTTWRGAFDTPTPGASNAGNTASPRVFGHLGFTGTSVWIDPDLGAVVLLTNRVHPSRDDSGPIKALRPRVHDAIWAALRRAAEHQGPH